jgi:hypothetical protein
MPVYESWFAIAAGERLVGIFITEHKWASDMHSMKIQNGLTSQLWCGTNIIFTSIDNPSTFSSSSSSSVVVSVSVCLPACDRPPTF